MTEPDTNPPAGPARHAPSAARNREPILEVLRRHLPATGLVLEIASGTGEHAVHFSSALPGITWQPTDREDDAIASIAAHRAAAALPNLRAPVRLDVSVQNWPVTQADAVIAINMIHIAPWSAGEALIQGAGRILPVGGKLFFYGPFRENGVHNAPSNEAFDADLKARNPLWGIRDIELVKATAGLNGLRLIDRVKMPANNLTLVFQRSAEAA